MAALERAAQYEPNTQPHLRAPVARGTRSPLSARRRLGIAVNDEREERGVVTQLPPRGLDDEVLKQPHGLGAAHAGRGTEDPVEGLDADRLCRTPVPLLDETVAVEKQPIAGPKETLRRARPGPPRSRRRQRWYGRRARVAAAAVGTPHNGAR